MGKIALLILIVFLAVLGLFAVENKDAVIIKIPFGISYEIPKIALMLLSTTAGALAILMYFFMRDTIRVIENMQYQRRKKKEARIKELYSKSLNAIFGGKWEEAKGHLIEVLKDDPAHLDALLKLGELAVDNNDYKTALEYLQKAHEQNPKNLQALFSLETVMEGLQREKDAMHYLEVIFDMDHENLTALYRKQAILERQEKWDDLISLQKSILKTHLNEKDRAREEKKLLGYKYEYARFSLENKEIEKAEKGFRTLLKTDSSFVPAYLGVAEVFLTKGESEDAINLLEKSFEQLNSLIIIARLEDLLLSVGEPGRLIRFYKNAITKRNQDNRLKFLLAKLYYRLEMVDDAMETLNTIDSGTFATMEMHVLKGELLLKRNQVQMALTEFKLACGHKHFMLIPY
ncbi:MAG: tetratricopeptide repeat protein, partial [Nitrospirae bacterium]|nr:tetratricopeptide repeat protein [Nitrospirota bacterium]